MQSLKMNIGKNGENGERNIQIERYLNLKCGIWHR